MVYDVQISPKAERDLENIYSYIATNFKAEPTAIKMVNDLMDNIESLAEFPNRCRKLDRLHRALDFKNYTIAFRVKENTVIVHSVKYSPTIH